MTERALQRYQTMLQIRYFDRACLEGVPTRDIHGELHTGIGQEAIAAGMLESLRKTDALISTHRNHGHALAKGVDPLKLMAEIFEKEAGLCGGYGGHMHPFDPQTNFSATGIVGAALPVALGYAYGFSLRGQDNVAVAITGDGGTNTGAFHESLNIAGAWRLPLVVVIENNGLGISVPIKKVSATATLAERGASYSAWSRTIDGMDVAAVAENFAEAMDFARRKNGPAILEAICHRHRGHFEGDHDTYRDAQQKQLLATEFDPILLERATLIRLAIADEDELDKMEAEIRTASYDLLAEVRNLPSPNAADALKHVFVEATK